MVMQLGSKIRHANWWFVHIKLFACLFFCFFVLVCLLIHIHKNREREREKTKQRKSCVLCFQWCGDLEQRFILFSDCFFSNAKLRKPFFFCSLFICVFWNHEKRVNANKKYTFFFLTLRKYVLGDGNLVVYTKQGLPIWSRFAGTLPVFLLCVFVLCFFCAFAKSQS